MSLTLHHKQATHYFKGEKMTATQYKMGAFIEIDHPFKDVKDGGDFDESLVSMGYRSTRSLCIPNDDFPKFELWEKEPCESKKKLVYNYFSILSFGDTGRDIFFDSWVDVLHFLQNYTSWIKTITDIELNNKLIEIND